MGIIRKQSIISSIFIYLGFIFGAFNTLYLFPHYLTLEQIGLTKVLTDISTTLAMLCTLGSLPAILKFYPFYRSYLPEKKNDLPTLTFFTCIIGCIIFILVTPVCREFIIRKFGRNSPAFVHHFNLIYPLTISYTFWYLFEASSWSIQKTVFSNFLKEVGFRVIITFFIITYILGFVNFNGFIHLFSFLYAIPVFFLFIYLKRFGFYHLTFPVSTVTKKLWKQITQFSLFIFSGQFLNIIAVTSSSIIISSQSSGGLSDTAVFTVASYLITLMDVPLRGITGIASSIISYAWKDKDIEKIDEMYKKTALTLVILGLGIWGIILLNANNAVLYFGTKYNKLPYLLIILGLSKIIDLGTGLNAQILISSKYWKIDFFTSMCFVILSVPLNVFLVKKYGLVGSSYATLISVFVYNATRFFVIRKIFKLQPYTKANLFTLMLAFGSFGLVYIIPSFANFYLDAVFRTVLFSSIYTLLILKLRISSDFNDLYLLGIEKIKRLLFKVKS